ncbi:hypothetical protein BDP27DRAFT_1361947 [Rhodocollybia butyracea]|uniref:Uncharacterized protein n=1 Tax=Rhodocollybia butyracea TaxID=206335 RepID=A0A9P5PSC4_9AGAR|nr:hypothetical protein BDP27DRAFT_1361947 [Rhodocollybia butyracea]
MSSLSDTAITSTSVIASTESNKGGGGFIRRSPGGIGVNDSASPKLSGALSLSRAASPSLEFPASGVQVSSCLSPVMLSKSVSFGTIGEAPANCSGSLSSLVNYNNDTDEVDDLVYPPSRAGSPPAVFGLVPNTFSTSPALGNTPDALRSVTSLAVLSALQSDSEPSPLPKRKLSVAPSLLPFSKRLQVANNHPLQAAWSPSGVPPLFVINGTNRVSKDPDVFNAPHPEGANRSPTIPSDDEYDALDFNLPDDLESIPALSTPTYSNLPLNPSSSASQSHIQLPALPSSSRFVQPSPGNVPSNPITPAPKDLRKRPGALASSPVPSTVARTPSACGSAARLSAIQHALSSVATQGASPTRPMASPTCPMASPSPAPKRRTLLAQIDSIMSPGASSSAGPPHPSDLFNDAGLSDNVVANAPLAEDADWLPFPEVYSPLDLSQKRCFVNPLRANPTVVQTVPSAKGTVDHSSLYSVVPIPLANNNFRIVREILVRPCQQEVQRVAAFFASTFGFDTAAFPASAGCISFTSMQFFEDQRSKFASQAGLLAMLNLIID